MKVSKTITFDVMLTPQQVARQFWDMDAGEQATFFNHLAVIAGSLPMQLQYVKDSKELTAKGKSVMTLIGDYGE